MSSLKFQVSSLKFQGSRLMAAALGLLACFVGLTTWTSAQAPAQSAQALFERAVTEFRNGRITQSVAAFDELAKVDPKDAPQLWQRGIALYYAKRYQDCRAQFESHRTVNPNDVENAAWHFLCVARAETPEKARSGLL